MLDTDVDRIRVDRLRTFIETRQQEAEQRRVDAVEAESWSAVAESTGELEALEAIGQYLDAESGDATTLDELRS